MREFFRGFFGKDSDESLKKSEQEKKDKSKKEVSRRGFLKALGAVGAGAALDSGVRKIYPRVEHAKNIFEAVIDYRKDLLNFEKNIAEEFSSFDLTNHRLSEVTTLEEFEEIRKRIYVKYNSAIIKISQNLLSFFREHSKLSSNDPNIYKFSPSEIESRKFFKEDLLYFYKLLSTFNGQGVLYQCASSQGEYASLLNMLHDSFLDKKDQSEEWGKRFCARAEDFLPRSQEIGNEDIDPFINFSNEGYLLASERKAESKWGKEDYQSAFKKVLDDNNIRSILQKVPELSLAGAYSLIKSTIEFKENIAPDKNYTEILNQLIIEREQFSNSDILNKDTSVIRFYGWDHYTERIFSSEPFTKIEEIIGGVKDDKVFETSHITNAIDRGVQNFSQALMDSRDKTFIFIKAHGGKDSVAEMEVGLIARQLISRIQQIVITTKNTEQARASLGEVVILSQACYGYDFLFKSLVPLMRQEWERGLQLYQEQIDSPQNWPPDYVENSKRMVSISFDSLTLPRVIGLSQEGNLVYENLQQTLLNHAEGLKKVGKLRGKDLLALEPELYSIGGDMSFSGNKEGKIFQISGVKKEVKKNYQEQPDQVA